MKMNAQQLTALWSRLKSNQALWLTTWDELAYYFIPAMVGFQTKYAEGEKKTDRLFDSIGMEVTDDISNFIASQETPQANKWFRLGMRGEQVDRAMEWLQECEDIQYAEMAESDFHAAIGEFFATVPVMGTASLGCIDKKDLRGQYSGLHYENIHMREMSGMKNEYGEINVTFREYVDTALNFYTKFKEDAGEAVIRDALERPDKEYTFVHAVYPRDIDDVDPAAFGFEPAADDRLPYVSQWVNTNENHEVKISGYYEPPRVIARWDENTDNSIAGHGLGLCALPDVRTLNEAKRLEMDAWEKLIDPPMKTTKNNVIGSVNFGAGEITTVDDMDGLQPLHEGTDWQTSLIKGEELAQNIRAIFFTDLIREPLGDGGPQKTRYEVAKRLERSQRILGEAMGRMRSEALRWIVTRTFSVLYRNGRFPPMPEGIEGVDLDVIYTSPIRSAQKSQQVDGAMMFVGAMGEIAQLRNPEDPSKSDVWDYLDNDGAVDILQDGYDAPAKMVRSDEQVAEMRKARQQAEAQAQQFEQARGVSEMVRDVGAGAGEAAGQQVMEAVSGG